MASDRSSNRTVRISHYSDEFARMQSDRHVGTAILRNMYENDKLCDVSLYGVPPAGVELSSLRPIRSYKAVLAHASKHLYELFTVDGYIDSHKAEYNIEIIDHESLRRIVEFIHTDSLNLNVHNAVEVVRKLLIGAKYLLMKDLAGGCEDYLPEQINSGNCISLWCFARKYSCLTLMEATSTFIATEHLNTLSTDEEFLRMPYADLGKLFMSEPVIAAGGEQRYFAAVAWLEFNSNTDSRSKYAYDVMNMIPLSSGLLSSKVIIHANENELLCEHVPELLRQAATNALRTRTIPVAVPQVPVAAVEKTAELSKSELGCLTIKVRFSDQSRESLSIECAADTTIGELKKRIEQLENFLPRSLRRHRYTDELNNDNLTLGNYGIMDKAWIYAM